MKKLLALLMIMFFLLAGCAADSGGGGGGGSGDDDDDGTITDGGGDGDSDDDDSGDDDNNSDSGTVKLTNINLNGATVLGLRLRSSSQSSPSFLGKSSPLQSSIIEVECMEMVDISGDQHTALTVGGDTPCFSNIEFWDTGLIYGRYFLRDATGDATGETYSFITDISGDVHHFADHPIVKDSFSNSNMVHLHDGLPTYINPDGKLAQYDMTTDSETVIIDQEISNFHILDEKTDGYHIIVDTSAGVKQIKPDLSEELLDEISDGQWYTIADNSGDLHIQYEDSGDGRFKNMRFDASGDIVDRNCTDIMNCTSIPVTFQYWLDNGEQPNGSAAMPTPPNMIYSIHGCSIHGNIMICNGRAYRINGADGDLEQISWIDYGHPNFESWADVRSCASESYIYFYSQSDYSGTRLTWIDESTGQFRDILDTHQIYQIECVSDDELLIIGVIDETADTIRITDADTVSPVVTIIESVSEIIIE